jgi:hypothetical protein
MYCNDWSEDPGDSSWWIPVALTTSVGRAGAGPRGSRGLALAGAPGVPSKAGPALWHCLTDPAALPLTHHPPVPAPQAAPAAVQWHAFNVCDSSLPVQRPPPGGWLLANAGRTGFYRVNYSTPLWEGLIEAARDAGKVPKIDLAGMLDDAFAMALVGGPGRVPGWGRRLGFWGVRPTAQGHAGRRVCDGPGGRGRGGSRRVAGPGFGGG